MPRQLQLVRPGVGPPHRERPVRPGCVYAVRPPATPLLANALGRVDWSDAFAVDLATAEDGRDPQGWADAIFRAPRPPAARILFGARELMVRAVGIERGGPHVFDTVSRSGHEVLLGTDQKHLAFRASVLVDRNRVVLSTVVELRNRRGRAYFALVRRLHPFVVRAALARAARTSGDRDQG